MTNEEFIKKLEKLDKKSIITFTFHANNGCKSELKFDSVDLENTEFGEKSTTITLGQPTFFRF